MSYQTLQTPSTSESSYEGSIDADLPDAAESMVIFDRYRGGDEAALNDLLERYQRRLHRIVRIKLGKRLRQHLESMDVVQEVNIVAARKFGEFEPQGKSSILNWLSRIALNQIRAKNDYFGAEKRNTELEVSLEVQRGPQAGAGAGHDVDDRLSPPERAWRKELREILDECMVELRPTYKNIILLRDYCGMSWREVIRETGHENEHAAQQHHRRAWIKLRRLVRPRLGELR
ncbi:MAG: sigma-70 family RNA polymerase sigma factor [bacterium]|nr:sigma-70 family RNA polymerase sigma factor [bacterium]